MRAAGLAWLMLAGCGRFVTVTTSTPPVPTSTRYHAGDFVVYRYEGSALAAPVSLREQVTARKGNRLRIDVEARRGTETRRWTQVVTDTPENQRSNRVDALYEELDGRRVLVANTDNRDLARLYDWVLVSPDGRAEDVEQAACTRTVANARRDCICTTGRNMLRGRALLFEESTCSSFVWTHGPASFRDAATGEVLLHAEVVETGRVKGRSLPLLPR